MSSYTEEPQNSKIDKKVANYRVAPEGSNVFCGNCVHYLPETEAGGYGYCELVRGRISSAGLCDYWEGE